MRYFILICLVLVPHGASAARFYFDGPATLRTGDTVAVTLSFDTEGESVNALEGSVILSGNVAIAGIREDDSIVSLWVARPTIEGGRTSSFSGIIPGGFTGVLSPFWEGARPGSVYTLLLEGTAPGEARISLAPGALVLRNDGHGTRLPVTASDFELTVQAGPGGSDVTPPDEEEPLEFLPVVGKDPSVFKGDWFLAFAAADTGSGIDHYEVAETKTRWGVPTYARAESPYRLVDQSLASYIYVKAVDRAGNERIAAVEPSEQGPKAHAWLILLAVILLALTGFLLNRRYGTNR